MFTVKHEGDELDFLYPDIKAVSAERNGIPAKVFLTKKDGEMIEINYGNVYVMNEVGKTVQVYRL